MNEDFVRFTDGSIICVQCHEGRHDDCPAAWNPILDGRYFCECSDPVHPEEPGY